MRENVHQPKSRPNLFAFWQTIRDFDAVCVCACDAIGRKALIQMNWFNIGDAAFGVHTAFKFRKRQNGKLRKDNLLKQ